MTRNQRHHTDCPALPGRAGRVWGDERGASSSIEMVILLPLLFTVMFLGVQAAMYYYAGTIALAAAQDGARAAAGTTGQGDPATAARVATGVLSNSDGSLEKWQVTSSRTPDTVTVTVTGTSISVVPGWQPTISKTATAPIELLS